MQETFDYKVNDRASSQIDQIIGKVRNLKSAARETRKSFGDLKQGLRFAQGLGFSSLGSMIPGVSNGSSFSERTENGIKMSVPKSASTLGEIGSFAAFTAGGLIASEMTSGLFERFAQPAVGAASASVGSKLGSALSKGGKIGKMLSGLGRFAPTIAAGAATMGVAVAAQLAYEYGVQPTIDQFTMTHEFTQEKMNEMSAKYLLNKRGQTQEIWNAANEGYGPTMWLLREGFGQNEEDRERMRMQIKEESIKRNKVVQNALWLQYRE